MQLFATEFLSIVVFWISLVSFVGITSALLLNACLLLGMLIGVRDFITAVLKDKVFALIFASNLGKLHRECRNGDLG
jgi:hypothetical protein